MSDFNIQKAMSDFFLSSCYAYCLAYLYDTKAVKKDTSVDYKKLTLDVVLGYQKGYIEQDGYVSNPVDYVNILEPLVRVKDVAHVNITSLKDIPKDEMVAVKYKLGNLSHFVVAHCNGIIFNPFPGSAICLKGKPVSYRKFTEVI